MVKRVLVSVGVGVAVLVVLSPMAAAATAAAITDPIGDAMWWLVAPTSTPPSAQIPNYQDIAGASISKQGNTFILSMDMAVAIPAAPPLPRTASS